MVAVSTPPLYLMRCSWYVAGQVGPSLTHLALLNSDPTFLGPRSIIVYDNFSQVLSTPSLLHLWKMPPVVTTDDILQMQKACILMKTQTFRHDNVCVPVAPDMCKYQIWTRRHLEEKEQKYPALNPLIQTLAVDKDQRSI